MTPTEAQRLSEQARAIEVAQEVAVEGRPMASGPRSMTSYEQNLVCDTVLSLARQLAEADERLALIARNAEAWHHDDDAKQRALSVIAGWANGGELPASLLADLRSNPPDPPAPPPKDPEAAAGVEGAA